MTTRVPLEVTFVRTSCLLLQYDGFTVLTDPFFRRSMRGLPLFRKPGVALDAMPRVDLVVASHLHYDHFDPDAVRRLRWDGMRMIGAPGTRDHTSALGVPTEDVAVWSSATVGPVRATAAPAEHTGPAPAEVNFLLEVGPWRVFFGGDARWSGAYRQIADRLGSVDVALLPIGGTRIFGTRTTMNPDDAVRACNVMRPRWAVPIHEGGEWMPVPPASWHPGRNRHFVRRLEQSGLPVTPCVLAPGETARFDGDGFVRRPYRA